MSFSFFVITFLSLPNLLWWWIAHRRLRGRRALQALLAVFMAAMLAQALWVLLGPTSARAAHTWLPRWLLALSYMWHLLVLPVALVLAALGGLARLPFPRPAAGTDLGRRRFLQATATLLPPVAAGAGLVVALPGLDRFRTRRLDIAVPGLPPELAGLKIAHVSDLHYGKYTRRKTVDRIVAAVNGLGADLVCFTGDLIDLSTVDLDAAVEAVQRFEPRLFLCEGNHDLIADPDLFRRRLREAGVPLLRDEAATVDLRGRAVQVLGARWSGRDGHQEAVARVRALRDEAAFPILLAHHPHAFDEAQGFPLVLSGHTHGGQLMLNERLGAGPILFKYWSGLYRRDDRVLVVSNGVGNWFPVRTNAPAEIGLYTLRPA
jgi:predicted MPP superfamily phosphohydrolase